MVGRFMRCRLGFVALVAASLLGLPVAAGAQTSGGGSQQDQLQAQIAQLDQAGAAALSRLQGIQQQQTVLDARVGDLTRQVDVAQARLNPLADEANRLDQAVAQLEAIITTAQARLDQARRAFAASAAQLYRSARNGSEYQDVLADQPQDLVLEGRYLALVTQQRKDLINQVGALRAELDRRHKALAVDQAQAEAAANTARSERDRLASLRDQLGPAVAASNAQGAAVQATLAQIQGTKTQDQAELASIQAASDGISAELRSRGGGTASAPCQARPVADEGINQPFIPGRHPGIDLHASYGDPIHACRAGVVVSAGWLGGYGNAVIIDHGGGMATLYAHQSRMAVTAGEQVSAGQVIGYIGSTGFSTGPHLHFEVRVNGNPVDPAPYL
jgi:murein DD-endopeptidase MepM/ murein hydrolase activator NlpD